MPSAPFVSRPEIVSFTASARRTLGERRRSWDTPQAIRPANCSHEQQHWKGRTMTTEQNKSPTQRTPGDWKSAKGHVFDSQGNYILAPTYGMAGKEAEAEANGQLAATAPKLYDALLYMLDTHPEPRQIEAESSGVKKAQASAYEQARAVLREARGQQ
jgi:hypothetical protein